MSKNLIFKELLKQDLTYDELSLIIKSDSLLDELEALEDDGLISKSKKSGKYRVKTKKKNIEINEYNLTQDNIINILSETANSLYYINYKCGATLNKTKIFVENMVKEGLINKVQGENGIIYR